MKGRRFTVLVRDGIIPFAICLLANVTRRFIGRVLGAAFNGQRNHNFSPFFFVITQGRFCRFVTCISLVVGVATLRGMRLPIRFKLRVLVYRANYGITRGRKTIMATGRVVQCVNNLKVIRRGARTIFFITFRLTKGIFGVTSKAVRGHYLPRSIGTKGSVCIKAWVPTCVGASP